MRDMFEGGPYSCERALDPAGACPFPSQGMRRSGLRRIRLQYRCRRLVAVLFAGLGLALSWSSWARDGDIMVRAVKTGPVLVVDVEMSVKATAATVWEVMTDWDEMDKFIPSMQSSEIVSRVGNRSRVRQKGRVFLGP
ncbi:MAG: hypothetical protein FJY55_15665, partial [Betaproteobacteria bacterium]|nr:hypothetical protein [Betaproteobacteria bacterium]